MSRPRKPQAQRLVQRVESARPRKSPARSMPLRGRRSSSTERRTNRAAVTWNSTAKMFVIAIRLCTRYTPSQRRHVVARMAARSLASARRAK
jgi:hypothetical protein